jgi:hypothetical protein
VERSFTKPRAEVANAEPAALRASIVAAIGSEAGADSIMRSLERMGADESIEYFEITEVRGSRRQGGEAAPAWRVRADRGATEEEQPPTS